MGSAAVALEGMPAGTTAEVEDALAQRSKRSGLEEKASRTGD